METTNHPQLTAKLIFQDGKHFGLQTTSHFQLKISILPETEDTQEESEWQIIDYNVDPEHCIVTAVLQSSNTKEPN